MRSGGGERFFAAASAARAQGSERTFPQSKAAIEKALKGLPGAVRATAYAGWICNFGRSSAGSLPARLLSGKVSGERGCLSGGSVVRVSVEVTAWYADPAAGKSGYQVLTSNGRLEGDLLDQLAEQLAATTAPGGACSKRHGLPRRRLQINPRQRRQRRRRRIAQDEPTISAPVPRIPQMRGGLSSSLAQSLAEQEKEKAAPGAGPKKPVDDEQSSLQAEAASLEEILKNQAHPKNLVAVKKTGTPVVAIGEPDAPRLYSWPARTMSSRCWISIAIGYTCRFPGSRGDGSGGITWKCRTAFRRAILPADSAAAPTAARFVSCDSRGRQRPFPEIGHRCAERSEDRFGGKDQRKAAKDSGPQLRLEFAKSVLQKDYAELAQKSQELAGIVLIFDSVGRRNDCGDLPDAAAVEGG